MGKKFMQGKNTWKQIPVQGKCQKKSPKPDGVGKKSYKQKIPHPLPHNFSNGPSLKCIKLSLVLF